MGAAPALVVLSMVRASAARESDSQGLKNQTRSFVCLGLATSDLHNCQTPLPWYQVLKLMQEVRHNKETSAFVWIKILSSPTSSVMPACSFRWSVQVCVSWPWEGSSTWWGWSSLRVMASSPSPTPSGTCLLQLELAFITTPSGGTCT